jgi:hypothetical protein
MGGMDRIAWIDQSTALNLGYGVEEEGQGVKKK